MAAARQHRRHLVVLTPAAELATSSRSLDQSPTHHYLPPYFLRVDTMHRGPTNKQSKEAIFIIAHLKHILYTSHLHLTCT